MPLSLIVICRVVWALPVPDAAPLHVPAGFAEDQARFDRGLQTLSQGLQE